VVETTQAGHDIAELFSERSQRAGTGMVGTNPRAVADSIAFSGGYPDPSTLPIADLIDATRVTLERDGEWALQYAFGSGVPELVTQLRRKLERDQGIRAGVENILVTNGSSQALALIFELFVNPDDVVLAEAPFFMGALHRCHGAGAEVRELPLDGEGIVIADLERELNALRAAGKRAKLLYLVPNFQNPSGITYTLERRKAIVALAQEHGLPILEDDAYYDLRFEGQKLPTLYELDGTGLVMYCGTFSKILSAGMRLGWCVASAPVIARLAGLKNDTGTNPFASHIAAEFAASGGLQEHISELKELYRHRRDVMLAALSEAMPAGTTWTVPDGGFFIWLTLPGAVTSAQLGPLAQARGVTIGHGTMFFAHGGGAQNVRLAYSFNDDEQIRAGIAVLGELVSELLAANA
jgi:DNA-binding transcriptional MocR family regulator